MSGTTHYPRIGLACAGGIVEGAIYEIGALCALEDAIEGLDLTRLHAYVGVSSGAILVSCLANGITPRTLSRAIVSEAGPELDFRPEMFFEPALAEYLRRLGRVPEALAAGLRAYLRHPLDLSPMSLVAALREVIPAGLFDNRNIQQYLARIFSTLGRTDDFRDLPSRLRVVAVELDTAEVACFGRPGLDHVPISQAVQASTALPGLYNPVEIDGVSYIDGVARRTLHASTALEEGVDLLFCINPIVPVNLREKEGAAWRSLADHGLSAVLSQTFRTLVYSRMRTGFRVYEHRYPEADVLLIEPPRDDDRLFFSNIFSFSNRQAVCERAYRQTLDFLRDQAEELAPRLARHGLQLRSSVLHDVSRRLYEAEGTHPAPVGRAALGAAEATLDRLGHTLERLRERAAQGSGAGVVAGWVEEATSHAERGARRRTGYVDGVARQ